MIFASEKTPHILYFSLVDTKFLFSYIYQWNPSSHPLQQDTKGTWRISLDLKPGKFEYRFLLDGEWQNDPNGDSFVENPFGTSNCMKIVE